MKWLVLFGTVAVALCGCAHEHAAKKKHDEVLTAAVPVAEPLKPLTLIEVPQALPLPGQLKFTPSLSPAGGSSEDRVAEPQDPKTRVHLANGAARIEPLRASYINATQVWPYSEGALYQVYTSPTRVTDIALEAGETLIDVSSPDTVRWIIGDTRSGEGESQRAHITLKPTRADLKSNLAIFTDRRVYYLELQATPDTWMASVSWDYPQDRLKVLKTAQQTARAQAPVASGVALDQLNFSYKISGDSPPWRPLRAFDDGEKVYIQFPGDIAQSEMPPLFVLGRKGDTELVNYRVRSPYYIVDRLFNAAELRLGDRHAQHVRITREGGRRSR